MNPVDWMKSNPLATGTIVIVGGLVFFMIYNGGGSASPTAVNVSGPSDAQIASEAQLQALRIQQSDNANARATELQKASYQRDVDIKNLESSLAAAIDTNATSLAIQTVNSNTSKYIADLDSQTMQRQILAQENMANYQYQTSLAEYQTLLEQTRINAANSVTINTIQSNKEITLAGLSLENALANYQSNIELAGISANKDITLATVNNQGAIDLANTQGQWGYQTSQVQSQTQLSLADKSIQLASIQGQQQIDLANTQGQWSYQNNQLNAQNEIILADKSIDLANVQGAWNLQNTQAIGQNQLALETLRGDQAVTLANTQGNWQYNTAVVQGQNALDMAKTVNQGAIDLANVQGGYNLQAITANNAAMIQAKELENQLGYAQLSTYANTTFEALTHQYAIAQLESQSAWNRAVLEADVAKYQTSKNAAVAKNENRGNVIGGIVNAGITALASIFSDRNLKTDIQIVGTDNRNGLPLYTYNQMGEWRIGHIAQDIELHFPHAVTRDASGALMYDPRMLH